jgi:SAM-dependent methyltransferase
MQNKAATVAPNSLVLDLGAATCLYRPLFGHCQYRSCDVKKIVATEKYGENTFYGAIDNESDLLEIPLESSSFDVVLYMDILGDCPEPISVLRGISRLLKPGGKAFIAAPLGSGLHQIPFHFYGGSTPEWYKRVANEAGLQVIEITPNGGFFKHLAQECARAGGLYAGLNALHGPDASSFYSLLVDRLPRAFYALEEVCLDDRFTAGYFVELLKNVPEKAEQPSAHVTVSQSLPVVVTLMGGLGNQMFQYAFALALARKNKTKLKLDLTFLLNTTSRNNFTQRPFSLGMFKLVKDCELLAESSALPIGLTLTTERNFQFDEQMLNIEGGVHLQGYWQSWKYFSNFDKAVRESFALSAPSDPKVSSLLSQIKSQDAVGVHVRRGDLVQDERIASIHGHCSLEYYKSACRIMCERFPNARFYIFTDDPAWCEGHDVTGGRPCVIVSGFTADNALEVDFHLLMSCTHFVISNSTFSWWAAYLGDAPNKVVIAPDPWVSDLSYNTSDVLPESWLRIPRG